MDAPCCAHTFIYSGIPLQNRSVSTSSLAFHPRSTSGAVTPLVAVFPEASGEPRNPAGGELSVAQLMFRNMAAILYRNARRRARAAADGSSPRFPPGWSGSDPDEEPEEENEVAAEEGGVSEAMPDELESLQAKTIAVPRKGEPGDDR